MRADDATDSGIGFGGDRCSARDGADAGAAVSCSTSGTTLSVKNDTDFRIAELIRRGEEILVLGGKPAGDSPKAIACPGPTPTVTGIDRIEIEADLNGDDGFVVVRGSLGPDSFETTLEDGAAKTNLNRGEEAQPDVDFTARDVESLSLAGRAGNDELVNSSEGGGALADLLAFDFVAMSGGRGADAIYGGDGFDFVGGGRGRDSLRTSRGFDFVFAGPGRDRIVAGRGPDGVVTRDKAKDIGGCGGGRDFALADHRDRLHSCEKRDRKGGGVRGGISFLFPSRAPISLPD